MRRYLELVDYTVQERCRDSQQIKQLSAPAVLQANYSCITTGIISVTE